MKKLLLTLILTTTALSYGMQKTWIERFNESNYIQKLFMVTGNITNEDKILIKDEIKKLKDQYVPIFCKNKKWDMAFVRSLVLPVACIPSFYWIALLSLKNYVKLLNQTNQETATIQIFKRESADPNTMNPIMRNLYSMFISSKERWVTLAHNNSKRHLAISGSCFGSGLLFTYLAKKFYDKHKSSIIIVDKLELLQTALG